MQDAQQPLTRPYSGSAGHADFPESVKRTGSKHYAVQLYWLPYSKFADLALGLLWEFYHG